VSLPIARPAVPVLLALVGVLLAFGLPATAVASATDRAVAAAQVEEDPVEGDFEEGGEELTPEEEALLDEEFSDEEPVEDEGIVDAEVVALEQATVELGRAKRAAAGKLARLSRSAAVLRPCLNSGPGWKRIRAVEHASQRSLYTAAARRLLADMKLLLDGQQPRIVVYESAFERFVAGIRAAPIADPTLSAAIAAQARRLAAYRDIRGIAADCSVFNRLTKRVREFPTRSAAQIVRADYRSAPIARKIERHLSNQLAKVDRRHGISHRDAETLADAADLMVELGGEPGTATGFRYALSLR
jgi:hypothetical protein